MAIVAMIFGSTIQAYMQTGRRVEWTGYSLAAQSLAQQAIEQARSAVWDPTMQTHPNDVTNISALGETLTGTGNNSVWTGYTISTLDLPYSGNNYIMATNYITVKMIYVNGLSNVLNQFVRVDCVWPFGYGPSLQYYTNTVATLLAPDNRDPSTF